jgi:hypothetical protein
VQVQPLVIKGESHTKSNVGKIGGGAALGAIIGGIAGGGKGAAIGTLAGGAAGTGAAAATGKRPAVVEPEAVLSFTTVSASQNTTSPPTTNQSNNESAAESPEQNAHQTSNAAPAAPESDDSVPLFTLRDRRIIRNCVSEHAAEFPEGTNERPELPPGSDRQIRRGGTLTPEAQKQAQSLPLACVEQLPKIPNNMDRVVYSGRVLLIDSKNRILDLFYLDENQ